MIDDGRWTTTISNRRPHTLSDKSTFRPLKGLAILIALLLATTLLAQRDDYFLPPDVLIPLTPTTEPFTDTNIGISTFPVEQVTYQNGFAHGHYTSYWENGNIQYEIDLNEGCAQGISKQYYRTGTLYIEAQIWEACEHSTATYTPSTKYDHYGQYMSFSGSEVEAFQITNKVTLEQETDMVSFFPPYHGYFKRYWPNGNLMESSSYVNTTMVGYYFYYNEDGTMTSFAFYDTEGRVVNQGFRRLDGSFEILP